ncbi:hypothetical protein B0J13DRAFT_548922 [Dactylonectria estremocensis]|uniref:Uncharacterized protein n=1 Tax=Dactylonectria estremocensis TaxID=1079267 RepID=A0A9P9JB85_9HYPO|nr:hypothetical protein B0J13DRAFT_548922 [Dactylonectria estremocensis]
MRWPGASFGLLALASGGLLPQTAHGQRTERCLACVPEHVRDQVAVGFDLGQSYGTSVAYFHNGSAINLAKVTASPNYKALMKHATQFVNDDPPLTNDSQYAGQYLQQFIQSATRYLRMLGFRVSPPDPSEAAIVLTEVISSLKEDSEAALGMPIARVSVTAPWLRAWQDAAPDAHPINEALLLAGLTPFPVEPEQQVYITETQAILAASGRQFCQPFGSSEHVGQDEDAAQNHVAFLISYTGDTVYTGIQSAICFPHNPQNKGTRGRMAKGGNIFTDKASTQVSWSDETMAIIEDMLEDFIWYNQQVAGSNRTGLILFAGEGSGLPALQDATRGMVELFNSDTIQGYRGFQVIRSDGTNFAAAKGAAMWSRLRLEAAHYCRTSECGQGDQPFSPLDGLGQESCGSTPRSGQHDDEDTWLDI